MRVKLPVRVFKGVYVLDSEQDGSTRQANDYMMGKRKKLYFWFRCETPALARLLVHALNNQPTKAERAVVRAALGEMHNCNDETCSTTLCKAARRLERERAKAKKKKS